LRRCIILSGARLWAQQPSGQVNCQTVARKTKRRQTPAKTRRPATTAAPGTATVARPAAESRAVGGDQAIVRSVEMSLSPGQPARRGSRVVLDSADPAIPLDRVPYFLTDLARLGIVAAAMVVLLVVGAVLIVPRVIQ
jgi:hypothetical protein